MPAVKRQRSKQAALSIMLIVVALIAAVVATERGGQAQTGSNGVTLDEIATALRGRGLDVAPTGKLVRNTFIRMSGQELRVEDRRIDVYLFASVADRVKTEQRIVRNVAPQDTLPDAPRVTSVSNALILLNGIDGRLAVKIQLAVADIASAPA